MRTEQVAEAIIALERAALDRWGAGDPSGYLEISAPEVTYFDPFLEHRIDGLEALTAYYEALRGRIRIDRDEWIAPRVQLYGETVVLTFQLIAHSGPSVTRWNCCEIYRHVKQGWRIVHTNWSITQHLDN